jgi:uncharacterized membrane protein HdeD (DUF308 family)
VSTSAAYGEVSPAIVRKWGWFVALGVVLIVLGIIAWLDAAAVTLVSTIVIGAILLVGGAFQIFHSLWPGNGAASSSACCRASSISPAAL